jgi:hypothetical protein
MLIPVSATSALLLLHCLAGLQSHVVVTLLAEANSFTSQQSFSLLAIFRASSFSGLPICISLVCGPHFMHYHMLLCSLRCASGAQQTLKAERKDDI